MGKYLEQQYEERDYALELAKKHGFLENTSDLTWEELKDKAKEMGLEIIIGSVAEYTYEKIIMSQLHFYRDGIITCPFEYVNIDGYLAHDRVVIAEHRTPEQMLMIMKGLECKELTKEK